MNKVIDFIILYSIIAAVSSIAFAYSDYRLNYSYMDVDEFLNDNHLNIPGCILISLFWPITLVIILFISIMPKLFKLTFAILDKIFFSK